MNGTFMGLVIVEAVLTAAAIVMFLYRGMLDMKEEDHLILDNDPGDRLTDGAGLRPEQPEQQRHEVPDCARGQLTPIPMHLGFAAKR